MTIFVIHEHHARSLHYDFRLEIAGKLKSWAIRKAPPKKAGLKRLAIQTEDHAMSYASFEGEIREGYGKGIVKIWDSGKYKMQSQKKEKMVFELHGKKLKGSYVLLRFRRAGERTGSPKSRRSASGQWLFFRKKVQA